MDEVEGSQEFQRVARDLETLRSALKAFLYPTVYHRVRFWASLAAGMTFNIGVALLFGPPQRVSASAYWVIATFGGHIVWGLAFVMSAILTAISAWQLHKFLRFALLIQSLPYLAISTSFAVGAIMFPDANLTGAPVYGWIMIMHAFLSDYARKEF